MTIPVEVEDITAAWLEEVLRPHAPGATLQAIEVADAHSGTTGRARVLLTHDDPRLPRSVFVKLAPFDAGQRAFVEQLGMGLYEARFYAELAAEVPVRHPRPWYAAHDDAGRYVMVLEDLLAVGARYPDAARSRPAGVRGADDRCLRRAPCRVLGEPALRAGRRPRVGRAALARLRFRGADRDLRRRAAGASLPDASRRLAEVYLSRADGMPRCSRTARDARARRRAPRQHVRRRRHARLPRLGHGELPLRSAGRRLLPRQLGADRSATRARA